MILIVDNYDSFTYNLEQRLGEIDASMEIRVFRNDQITLDEIAEMQPSHLIISPGPCTPNEAGISMACVKRFHGVLPVLGVCLGHQSIGQATGAKIVRAAELKHGKTDLIYHRGQGLFAGLPNPMTATRYHSLVIQPDTLSAQFEITAWVNVGGGGGTSGSSGSARGSDDQRIIMGIAHRDAPTFGLQFHPESFLTEHGSKLLNNFLQTKISPPSLCASPS